VKEYQVKTVGDVAASKFYHLPNYPLTTQCPYCEKVCRITQGDLNETNWEKIDELVGYARIGICSRCRRKMVVGFRLAQKRHRAS
jgi:hypothetical protein